MDLNSLNESKKEGHLLEKTWYDQTVDQFNSLLNQAKENPFKAVVLGGAALSATYILGNVVYDIITIEPAVEIVEKVVQEPSTWENLTFYYSSFVNTCYEWGGENIFTNVTRCTAVTGMLAAYYLQPAFAVAGFARTTALFQTLPLFFQQTVQLAITSQIGWTLYNYYSWISYYLSPPAQVPDVRFGKFTGGGGSFEWPGQDTAHFIKSMMPFIIWLGESIVYLTEQFGLTALKYTFLGLSLMIGAHYVKEYVSHNMERPTLSRKYHFSDWRAKLYDFATAPVQFAADLTFGAKEKVEPKKPIFNAGIQEQLDDIVSSLENVQQNKGSYENVILYGPPGTGKSMTAQYIAENCGMNFMEISGGDLAKYIGSKTSPVEEMNKVFSRMNASSKPTVLFIDEFDGFATDRSKLDTARVEILNTFLNLTGTPSNKVMVIAATNRAKELDYAINNRFGDKIFMGPPAAQERLAILKMYVDEFFTADEDQAIFNEDYLGRLNARLDGQTGRTIYKLINKCYVKKNQQKGAKITEALIDKTITRFLDNEMHMQTSAA